jgi:integrase/recombinase XerD
MTELRRRMIECLQLRGLSERTQDMYVRAVRQLAEHYRKSPDLISEEELRQYFLYVKHVTQYSRSASTIALCGIKFFFEQTLHRDWTTLRFVRAPRAKKLPVILSLEEVRRLLDCVRLPRYRVCLTTIYSCGLRLQEGTHLKVPDIDSSRMLIHVRHGKGGQDRYVPVPHRTLARLRQYGVTHRHPVLIFPAPGRGGNSLSTATAPMPRSSVQGAFREALQDSGIHKHASVHTLRHSWATHVLEAGVNLRLIHAYLGHSSPTTTSVYTHLTARAEHLGADAINRVMADL